MIIKDTTPSKTGHRKLRKQNLMQSNQINKVDFQTDPPSMRVLNEGIS